jgi:hypothetical protein
LPSTVTPMLTHVPSTSLTTVLVLFAKLVPVFNFASSTAWEKAKSPTTSLPA